MDTVTFLTILHLFGVAIGAGGAYTTDGILLTAIKDRKMTHDEFKMIRRAGTMVICGLGLLILSGIGLFLQDPATYLASSKFIAKMIVVAILTANGILLHIWTLPLFERHLHTHLLKQTEFAKHLPALTTVGAISFTSWSFALVMGALRSSTLAVWQLLLIYGVFVVVLGLIGYVVGRRLKRGVLS